MATSSGLNGLASLSKEYESSDDEPCAKKFKSDDYDVVETCETKAQTSDSLKFEANSTAESTTENTEDQPCEDDKSGEDMEVEPVESIPEKPSVEAAGNAGVSCENKEELLDQEEPSIKESSKEEISGVEDANTNLEESSVKKNSGEEVSDIDQEISANSEEAAVEENSEKEILDAEKETKTNSEEATVEKSSEKVMSDAEKEAKTNSEEDSTVEKTSSLEDDKKGKAKCWSCKKNEAIYTCPGCLIKTCSLPCVKLHKEKNNCDGIRNPITHITKKSDYKETDFISDYRFLERVNQQLTRNTDDKRICTKHWLNKKINTAKHYDVTLQFLPQSFSRSMANRSRFNFKLNTIQWDVEWVFMNGGITKHHNRCPGETSLNDAMSKYLDLRTEQYDHRLDEYLKVKRSGGENFRFYLRREFQPTESKYVQLDGDADLYSSLRGQTIVEFPYIHVVLPRHFEHYEPFATSTNTESISTDNTHVEKQEDDAESEKDEDDSDINYGVMTSHNGVLTTI